MPVYEYECAKGHRFERVRSFKEEIDSSRCPTCGKQAKLVPSLPGKPVLKAGIGGFHAPTKP